MALVKTMLNGHEVEYDDKEFELKVSTNYINFGYRDVKFLHYSGDGKDVRNPKGNISCRNMFYEYKGELDLSNFDTSNVVNMRNMFCDCECTSLDLSSFNTSKVTDMEAMFYCCKSLKELNLSNFDTSKVKNMNSMFYMCFSLEELDLSSFNTSKVTDMGSMFSYCESLKELDISSFDTSNATNVKSMFYNSKLLGTGDSLKQNLLKQSLLNNGDGKVLYKTFKKLFNISDSDFINTLYELKPTSQMLPSYENNVLVPKIEKFFNDGLTIGNIQNQLCDYDSSFVNNVLVNYLGDLYIIGKNFQGFLSSDEIKILNYFNIVGGNSSLTVKEVKLKACKDFNEDYVNKAILKLLSDEKLVG